jgi:hypothetical protein
MLRTMQLISLTTSNLDFNINKNFPVERNALLGFIMIFKYILYKWRGVINKENERRKLYGSSKMYKSLC